MKQKTSYLILGILVGILCTSVFYAFSVSKSSKHAAGSKVLKLAHGLETTHPVNIAMEFMAKRLEELSGGKMSIDIYSGGALGDETKCIEQLKNGSLDMTKASSATVSMFVEDVAALTIPYLFRDSKHYWGVLDSDIGKGILSHMNSEGLVGLCFYDAGSRCFYTVKKPIEKPDDLKGLKIRVMNAKNDMKLMECFGASPTPISAGETYTSLAQGVVDGAENNFPTYFSSAHFEVCPNFTVDEHTRLPDILIISETSFQKLSSQEQEWLRQAARESSVFQRKLWAEKTQEARNKLIEKKVRIIEVNQDAFREKVKPMYEELKGTKIGELVEKIRNFK